MIFFQTLWRHFQRYLSVWFLILFLSQCFLYREIFADFASLLNFQIWFPLSLVGLTFSGLIVAIEAFKWGLASGKKHGYLYDLKQVLKGYTWAFITPAGWGDYYGRIHGTPKAFHSYGFIATFLSRITNSVPTLSIGLVAFAFYFTHLPMIPWKTYLLFWLLFLFTMGVFLYCFRHHLKSLLRFWQTQSNRKWIRNRTLGLIPLSYLKFLIFSLQFLFLYQILGGEVDSLFSFLGILWCGYFIRQFFPNLFFGNLGVRESINVLLYTIMGYSGPLILQTSLFIFLFNHFLLAVIGAYFYWRDERVLS